MIKKVLEQFLLVVAVIIFGLFSPIFLPLSTLGASNQEIKIATQSAKVSTKSANKSATASPSIINKLKQIESLKEKLATKVTEIREKDKKAFFGEVKNIKEEAITLATNQGERIINYAEDTIFYEISSDGSKKEIRGDKISEKTNISAFGYLKDDKTSLIAKYIYLHQNMKTIFGKIADIDKSKYTINVKGKEGEIVIDVETYTKSFAYVKNKGWQKIGFSKFKIGDAVYIFAQKTGQENKISANKIYVLPTSQEISLSATPEATPTENISPTKALKQQSATSSSFKN